jgi:hypothetical protein
LSEGLLAALPGYKGPDVYSRRASLGQGVRNHHPRLRPPDGGAVDQGEARSNPNFYVYVVENVGQGDPAEFTLRVLAVRGYNGCWSGLRSAGVTTSRGRSPTTTPAPSAWMGHCGNPYAAIIAPCGRTFDAIFENPRTLALRIPYRIEACRRASMFRGIDPRRWRYRSSRRFAANRAFFQAITSLKR